MKKTIKFRFAGIGIMVAMFAVFGVAVMLLWNALMPQIFGLPEIDYLRAAGLLILARVLFGGMGNHPVPGRGREDGRLFSHGNKLREKWMGMSEEERREFMAKEKDFFTSNRRFSRMADFFDDDERTKANRETGEKKEARDE